MGLQLADDINEGKAPSVSEIPGFIKLRLLGITRAQLLEDICGNTGMAGADAENEDRF